MCSTPTSTVEPKAVQTDRNASFLTSFVTAWNGHNIEEILSYFSPDCDYFDLILGGHFHGHQELGDYFRYFFATIVNHRVLVQTTISDGDLLAYSWQCSGQRRSARDRTVSSTFSLHGISMAERRDGLITKLRQRWDLDSYLPQIGCVGNDPRLHSGQDLESSPFLAAVRQSSRPS
jgi:ketosteroid isomerase-like protein